MGKAGAIVLGNDIADETPEHCSEKLNKLCVDTQKNSNDSKIIESMEKPRADVDINRKIAKFNVLLQDKLGDMKDVFFVIIVTCSTVVKWSSGPRRKTSLTIGKSEVWCKSIKF